MAGFGSFMEGMQGGMQTMDRLKDSRIKRELYDRAITESDMELEGKDFSRARMNLPAIKRHRSSDTLIGKLGDKLDPVMARFLEKMGRGSGAIESPTAGALEVSSELQPAIPEFDPSSVEAPDQIEFAGGSPGGIEDVVEKELGGYREDGPSKASSGSRPKMTEEEFARRRAAAKADLTGKADQIRPVQHTSDANRKVIDRVEARSGKRTAIPESPAPKGGMLRKGARFLGRAAAVPVIAGAGVGGIKGAMGAEAGEGYRQLEQGEGTNWYDPLVDPQFYKDMGNRAVEAGKGAIAGALNPIDTLLGRDEEEAAPAAAPQEAIPDRGIRPGAPPSAVSRKPSVPSAPAAAIPETAPAEADPLASFDISKFKAAEVPNFSNNDWIAHRQELMEDLVMNGMSYAEAWDKVDQQVVATQQRGFMHFANQAYTALTTGGKASPAAAAAVRAAFQYLPTTTDIQVGEYNGHLVAFSIDEDTGEQVGQPMVITPELLQGVMANFKDPKAWAEHAQDNRKLDQADRELDQGDRRLGALERGLEIEAFKAETDAGFGGGGGSSGGLKPGDIDRAAQQSFLDAAASATKDPRAQRAIVALMARLYREGGGLVDAQTIADRVARYAENPEGLQEILAETAAAIGD